MRFDFFTLGGSQFWEDVFFYQKWRIQRNYKTKQYRLLDNWDIRRVEGRFENCRRAFLKYIEVFQLSRQKGHMVIMLHGLGESKNIFKPLWREALKNGYMAAAINYPSTRKRIDGHIRQLDFFMNHLEDVQEVSFVTNGIGGVILRKLLSFDSPWRHKIKLNRIVEVSPPNQGSTLFKLLDKYRLFQRVLGPILKDVTPEAAKRLPPFENPQQVGIINCVPVWKRILFLLPEKWRQMLGSGEEAELKGVKQTITIKNTFFNPFKNEEVVRRCVKFLNQGKF